MKTDKVEQSVFQKGAKVTPGGRCISARTREKFDVLLESSKKHYYDDYLSSDALKSPTNREGQSAFGFADVNPDLEPSFTKPSKKFEWIASTRVSASKHNYNAVTPFEDRKNPDKEYTNYSWRRAASATNKDLAGRPFKKSMSRAGIIPLPTTRAAVAQDLKKFDEALGIVQDDGHGNIDLELSKSSGNDGTLLHSDQSSAGTSTNHSKSAGYLTSKQRMEPMPYRPHTAGVAPKQKFALVEEVDEQDMLNNLDPNVTDRYFSANAKERFARTYREISNRRCKVVDDVEMRQLIEGRGRVPGEMKKSLIQLDEALIRQQHSEQRRKIQSSLDLIPRNVEEDDMDDVPAWTEADSHRHEALGRQCVTGSHISHAVNKAVHHGSEKATKMQTHFVRTISDFDYGDGGELTPSRMNLGGLSKITFFDVAKTAFAQDLMYKNEFTSSTSFKDLPIKVDTNAEENADGKSAAGTLKRNPFAETYEKNSPRALFLSGCLEYDLPPRSSVLLRSKPSATLDLRNKGLTDQLALLLAESLSNDHMPAVRSVLLAGNRQLTEASIPSLLTAIVSNTSITELDLSSLSIFGVQAQLHHHHVLSGQERDHITKAAYTNIQILQPLLKYISRRYCPLRKLTLADCHMDDEFCAKLVDCLLKNYNFEELDLSHNLLGSHGGVLGTVLNAAKVDRKKIHGQNHIDAPLVCGGELLSTLLRCPTCPLKTLNVQYNMIKSMGAVDLCDAVKYCKTLVNLDLSYNELATEGAMALGSALMDNKSLKNLNVSYCSIGPEGAFVLAVGIRDSLLRTLKIDGNSIGELGASALISVSLTKGAHKLIDISSNNCDINVYSHCKGIDFSDVMERGVEKGIDMSGLASKHRGKSLDFSDPVGWYSLTLSSCLGRAIFLELLNKVSHLVDVGITELSYNPSPVSNAAPKHGGNVDKSNKGNSHGYDELTLVKSVEKLPYGMLDDVERRLHAMYTANIELANKVLNDPSLLRNAFSRASRKKSGYLSSEECKQCLDELGLHLKIKETAIICKSFDCLGGGNVSCAEMYSFFELLLGESKEKLYDLQHVVFMALSTAPHKKYVPPTVGKVSVVVSLCHHRKHTNCGLPEHAVALTESQIIRASNVAKHSIHFGTMLKYIIGVVHVRFGEAFTLLHDIAMETGDMISLLAAILPSISCTKDAVRLVNAICGSDIRKFNQLEEMLGSAALGVLLGRFDGFYSLNLSKQSDRICLSRLLCLSESVYEQRKVKGQGDLSQQTNQSCFRNVLMVNTKLNVSVEDGKWTKGMFTPMPKHGKVEFDFSSTLVPDLITCSVCSDSTVLGFCDYVGLLDDPVARLVESASTKGKKIKQKPVAAAGVRSQRAIEQLRNMKEFTDGPTVGSSHCVPNMFWKIDYGRASAVAAYLRNMFYPNISQRSQQHACSQLLPKPQCGNRVAGEAQFKGCLEGSIAKYASGEMQKHEKCPCLRVPDDVSDPETKPDVGTDSEPTGIASQHSGGEVTPGVEERVPVLSRVPTADISTVDDTIVRFSSVDGAVVDARELTLGAHVQDIEFPQLETTATMETLETLEEGIALDDMSNNNHSDIPEETGSISGWGSSEDGDEFDIDAHIAECLTKGETLDHDRFTKIPRFASLDISAKQVELQKYSDQRSSVLLELQKKNIGASTALSAAVKFSTTPAARTDGLFSLESLCQMFFSFDRCLRSRHVALILSLYDRGRMNETSFFGTYRVDLLVSLFSKIVDVHNIELVFSVLTAQEHACFVARIGWLSIFNPWKIDHVWELDLGRSEEAYVYKMLLHIQKAENNALFKYQRIVLEPEKRDGKVIATADNRGVTSEEEQLNEIQLFNEECCQSVPTTGRITIECCSLETPGDVDAACPSGGNCSIKPVDMTVRDALLSISLCQVLWHEHQHGRAAVFEVQTDEQCLLGYSFEPNEESVDNVATIQQRLPPVGSVKNCVKLLKRVPVKGSESWSPYHLHWSYE